MCLWPESQDSGRCRGPDFCDSGYHHSAQRLSRDATHAGMMAPFSGEAYNALLGMALLRLNDDIAEPQQVSRTIPPKL